MERDYEKRMDRLETDYKLKFDTQLSTAKKKLDQSLEKTKKELESSLKTGIITIGISIILAIGLSFGTAYYNTRLQIGQSVLDLQKEVTAAYKDIQNARTFFDEAKKNYIAAKKTLDQTNETVKTVEANLTKATNQTTDATKEYEAAKKTLDQTNETVKIVEANLTKATDRATNAAKEIEQLFKNTKKQTIN